MIDHKAATDPDLRELAALIQYGIAVPRARLRPEQIRAAMEQFDPSQRVWPRAGTGYRKQRDECPHCHGMGKMGRGSAHGRHYWRCSLCGQRGAEKL